MGARRRLHFFWKRESFVNGPDWLGEAVGGYREPIYKYGDRGYYGRQIIGYRNKAHRSIRAIAMRFQDWEGNYHIEVVHY